MDMYGFYRVNDDTISLDDFLTDNISNFLRLRGAVGDEIHIDVCPVSNGRDVKVVSRDNDGAVTIKVSEDTIENLKDESRLSMITTMWQLVGVALRTWAIADQKMRFNSLITLRTLRVYGYHDLYRELVDSYVAFESKPALYSLRIDVQFIACYVAEFIQWHALRDREIDPYALATAIFKARRSNVHRILQRLDTKLL